MKTSWKHVFAALLALLVMSAAAVPALAAEEDVPSEAAAAEEDLTISGKALAAAIVVGLAAAGGAIAMGMGIAKSVDGISRQPEAEGKIRTTLMLGLVFVETVVIYALIVAILIIFVL